MTFPVPEPQPPATIGTQPQSAAEVNSLIGTHLRDFMKIRATINQDANFLAGSDLKVAPYYFTDAQESLMKSAVADLDASLDAIDLTFISQIVGM